MIGDFLCSGYGRCNKGYGQAQAPFHRSEVSVSGSTEVRSLHGVVGGVY